MILSILMGLNIIYMLKSPIFKFLAGFSPERLICQLLPDITLGLSNRQSRVNLSATRGLTYPCSSNCLTSTSSGLEVFKNYISHSQSMVQNKKVQKVNCYKKMCLSWPRFSFSVPYLSSFSTLKTLSEVFIFFMHANICE